MKLGGLFGQPKALAQVPPKKKPLSPAAVAGPEVGEAPPVNLSHMAAARAKKLKPGQFDIAWPKIKPQQLKDYAPILTAAELEEWLDRCIETGTCGFDWETAANEETRAAWTQWEKDFDLEGRRAHYLAVADEAMTIDLEGLDTLTEKQRATEEKRRHKAAEKTAKIWEAKAAELQKEYDFQRAIYLKTPLDPWRGDICTASLCPEPHRVRVVPISHKQGKVFEPMLTRDAARKLFLDMLDRKIFRNENVRKIAVNLSFETKYAAKYAKYIQKPAADPLVAWVRCMQLVAPEKIKDPKKPASGWGLKPTTLDVFGVQMGNFTELLQKHGADFFDEIAADRGEGLEYSAEDADYAVQHDLYWMEIAKQIPRYEDWLNNIEMPFGRVIGLMEYWGMKWDPELAETKRKEAIAAQAAAAESIREIIRGCLTGDDNRPLEVNVGKGGKTGEVRSVIFDLMRLPIAKLGDPTKREYACRAWTKKP